MSNVQVSTSANSPKEANKFALRLQCHQPRFLADTVCQKLGIFMRLYVNMRTSPFEASISKLTVHPSKRPVSKFIVGFIQLILEGSYFFVLIQNLNQIYHPRFK